MIRFRARTTPANLAELIDSAPRNARGPMTEAAAIYLIGNMRRGLMHYPAYKHITRRRAYGRTFSSPQQQRFVMASIRAGRNLKTGTPMEPGFPHRTGRLQRGWYVRRSGAKATVASDVEHVDYVMGKKQARLNKMVGWRTAQQVAKDNTSGMVREADRELQIYLRAKGL